MPKVRRVDVSPALFGEWERPRHRTNGLQRQAPLGFYAARTARHLRPTAMSVYPCPAFSLLCPMRIAFGACRRDEAEFHRTPRTALEMPMTRQTDRKAGLVQAADTSIAGRRREFEDGQVVSSHQADVRFELVGTHAQPFAPPRRAQCGKMAERSRGTTHYKNRPTLHCRLSSARWLCCLWMTMGSWRQES